MCNSNGVFGVPDPNESCRDKEPLDLIKDLIRREKAKEAAHKKMRFWNRVILWMILLGVLALVVSWCFPNNGIVARCAASVESLVAIVLVFVFFWAEAISKRF